jgi:hypothetical protein
VRFNRSGVQPDRPSRYNPVMNLREPPPESYWDKPQMVLRHMAFAPDGRTMGWPRSPLRRLWMRLRGWKFYVDEVAPAKAQADFNAALRQVLAYGARRR